MNLGGLVIATPIRGAEHWPSSVSYGYSESIRCLYSELRDVRVDQLPTTATYSTDAVRGRNRMAAMAIREFPGMSHLLWWDDDQWPEDRNIIVEMMKSGQDVIAAPYTNKREPMRWIHQDLTPRAEEQDGLLEMRSVGFGFTMTSRSALLKMWGACRKYTDWPSTNKVADMFRPEFDKMNTDDPDPELEGLLSEDFSFCKRWREIGGKVHLWTRAGVIYHAGAKAWSARDMAGGIKR